MHGQLLKRSGEKSQKELAKEEEEEEEEEEEFNAPLAHVKFYITMKPMILTANIQFICY